MFMMRVLSTIRREGKGKESDLITVGGPPSPPPPRPARAAPAAARPGDIHFSFCDFSVPKCVLVIESSCGPHLRIVSHMRTVIRTRIQSLFSGGFQGYSCTVAVISETDPPPRPVVKKRHTPVQRGNTGETTSGTGGRETVKQRICCRNVLSRVTVGIDAVSQSHISRSHYQSLVCAITTGDRQYIVSRDSAIS